MKGSGLARLFLFTLALAGTSIPGEAGEAVPAGSDWAVLISPAENDRVISRKPAIRGKFLREIRPETVVVIVDGTDYTPLAAKTPGGFEVTPPLPLPPGSHQVSVTGQDASGQPLAYTASFTSKHHERFDEAVSANDLTGTYEVAVHKPASRESVVSNAREEANLTSSSLLRKGPWKASLDGNARYKDQSLPVPPPEERGADVISYTFRSGYEKDGVRAEAAVGDVLVDETPYTLAALGRRGGTITADAGVAAVSAFSLRSDTVYGTRGGLSVDGGLDRHLRGGSGTVRLFSNRASLKAVYVDGGERAGSYNVGTTGGPRKGRVLGFQLTTDFFAGRFRTDFEADFSRFNADTSSSEFSDRKDHAFRAGGGGTAGIFTYDAVYEYVGRDYEVIGNPMLQKNREGGRISGSAVLGTQSVGVTASRYADNVREDPLLPVNVDLQAGLNYALSRWPALPVSISYLWSRQKNGDIPAGDNNVLDKVTDTVNAQATWTRGIVSAGLSGSYSKADDRTPIDADTTAWNARLAPVITLTAFSITPSAAYSEMKAGGARTDATTLGLDGYARLLDNKVTAEAGSSYVFLRTTNRIQDSRSFNGNFRLGYGFDPVLGGLFKPSLAFHGNYARLVDKVTPGLDKDEWTLFLTLSAQVPIVL